MTLEQLNLLPLLSHLYHPFPCRGPFTDWSMSPVCLGHGRPPTNRMPSKPSPEPTKLVVQGYLQIPGIDYSEVFSPTICLGSLWAIPHLAAAHGWYRNKDDVTGFGDGLDEVAEILFSPYSIKQDSPLEQVRAPETRHLRFRLSPV